MNDQNAGLHRMLPVDDGKVVGNLIAVGVVSTTVQVSDGEADTWDTCFGRGEFTVPIACDAELADAQRVNVEVRFRARIDVVITPVVDTEPQFVKNARIKGVDPLCGHVIGVGNAIFGKV